MESVCITYNLRVPLTEALYIGNAAIIASALETDITGQMPGSPEHVNEITGELECEHEGAITENELIQGSHDLRGTNCSEIRQRKETGTEIHCPASN